MNRWTCPGCKETFTAQVWTHIEKMADEHEAECNEPRKCKNCRYSINKVDGKWRHWYTGLKYCTEIKILQTAAEPGGALNE